MACAAAAAHAAVPPSRRPPVFPAFEGSPTARSAANQSAWNQDVSKAPLAAKSSAYIDGITSLGGNQVVHPDFGGAAPTGCPSDGRPQPATGPGERDLIPDESDFGRAPIPANAPVEGGSDRHVLVLQRRRCVLFEMFGAHYLAAPAPLGGGSTARFHLGRGRRRHDGWTSADAAGLRILPGLARYGEVKVGGLATRSGSPSPTRGAPMSTPPPTTPRRAVTPKLPPMGLRLRLSSPYFHDNLARFPDGSQSRVIFRALYHYGIINADNGGGGANWFITGARSTRWKDGDLNRLKTVPGSAFVVVKSQAPVKTPC